MGTFFRKSRSAAAPAFRSARIVAPDGITFPNRMLFHAGTPASSARSARPRMTIDPWGYVTHHHGRWGWGASFGWYWVPGVYYSPAWVAWNSSDSYFGWAPLGYWNAPCHWGYGAWGGGYCWNVVDVGYIGRRDLHYRIHSDVNILRNFNRVPGGRSLTPPWQRGPLMVTRNEFANPGQFQHAVTQRPLLRERMQTYDPSGKET